MSKPIICYSPELIKKLDKEDRDFPIDPIVLAILTGIKKTSIAEGHRDVRDRDAPRGGTEGHRAGAEGHRGGGRGGGRPNGVNGSNGYHPRSTAPQRKKLFDEPEAFSDEAFLASIKSCLGKLSSENYSTVIEQLLRFQLDKEHTLDAVAQILHEATINGVFIVNYYVDMILAVGRKYPSIIPNINKRIFKQISEPNSFADESDTLTETRQQKAERWQISNILIFAELYKKKIYNDAVFRKVLNVCMTKVTPQTFFNLKLIIELLQKILPLYNHQKVIADTELRQIMNKLSTISKEKEYPGIVRFPLMNAIKIYEAL